MRLRSGYLNMLRWHGPDAPQTIHAKLVLECAKLAAARAEVERLERGIVALTVPEKQA